MHRLISPCRNLFLSVCLIAGGTSLAASPPDNFDHPVGTWATAPQAASNANGKLGAADTTFREIVHVSAGGSAVRIVLTNEYGLEALVIAEASVAISRGPSTDSTDSTNSAIDPATMRAVTFGGQTSISLPAGAMMISDPVALSLPPLTNIAVSLFIPRQPMRQATVHDFALQDNYTVAGNAVKASVLENPAKTTSWHFLKGINVKSDAPGAAIVTLGDSITDGADSIRNENGRWPDILASRLQADKKTAHIGVLNVGINGNRLLYSDEGGGDSALTRFDRDVLAQAGAKYLIILEGINDIGHIVSPSPDDPATTAASLQLALTQLAERAHTHGIKVIGGTILPYAKCKYASAPGDKMRQVVNQWIRTTSVFDGVVDFDKIVRDPAQPDMLLPAYDSGDHLHPNSAGLRAMGAGIELDFFLIARLVQLVQPAGFYRSHSSKCLCTKESSARCG